MIRSVSKFSKFQSTHPHGCDNSWWVIVFNPRTRTSATTKTAPTLSNGGRNLCQCCFNPRTRTGCDCRVFKPALGADQKCGLREPHFFARFLCYNFVKNRCNQLLEPSANLPGISCSLGVRAKTRINLYE